MNRILYFVLLAVSLLLIAYNVTLVDFQQPFTGNSTIALIGIVASLCAIILLLIFVTSRKIKNRIDEN